MIVRQPARLFVSMLLFLSRYVSAGKMSDAMTALKGNKLHTECAPLDELTKCHITCDKLQRKLTASWSEMSELNIQLQRLQQEINALLAQHQDDENYRARLEEHLTVSNLEIQRLRQYPNQVWLPPAPGPPPAVPVPVTPRKKKSLRFQPSAQGGQI